MLVQATYSRVCAIGLHITLMVAALENLRLSNTRSNQEAYQRQHDSNDIIVNSVINGDLSNIESNIYDCGIDGALTQKDLSNLLKLKHIDKH